MGTIICESSCYKESQRSLRVLSRYQGAELMGNEIRDIRYAPIEKNSAILSKQRVPSPVTGRVKKIVILNIRAKISFAATDFGRCNSKVIAEI